MQKSWKAAARLALIAVGSLIVGGGVVGGAAYLYLVKHAPEVALPPEVESASRKAAADGRKERQRTVAHLSLAPLPEQLPLRGEPGKDAAGYPTQWIDVAALRSLLFHGRVDALTGYIEELQTAAEADPRKEFWIWDAVEGFGSAEPELRAALDAWVAAKPASFAPYLARGAYLTHVGYARRGTKWASETHRDDLDAMGETHEAAASDLHKALELHPNLTPAWMQLGRLAETGERSGLAARQRAIASCPSCLQPRLEAIARAAPRWGGSHEAMRAVAAQAPVALNPSFAVLPGYVDRDLARRARESDHDDEALVAIDRACALGPHAPFLEERALDLWGQKKLDDALRDAEAAAKLRPGTTKPKELMVGLRASKKDWEGAAQVALELLRTDPTSSEARRQLAPIVVGLRDEARKLESKDPTRAIALLDQARELAMDKGVEQLRAKLITPKGDLSEAQLAELEKEVTDHPGDFLAMQRLDYALARVRRFERVVELWTAFLARHPDHGPAYMERGGAHSHLKRGPEARADAMRACELGLSAGCGAARFIPYGAAPKK